MKHAFILAALALGLVDCVAPPRPQGRIEGEYLRVGTPGVLTVAQAPNGRWAITILASGDDRGPATAADCYIEAEAELFLNLLHGRIVPFENKELSVGASAEDLERDNPDPVIITFEGRTAVVRLPGQYGCGLGAGFVGVYRRR